MLRRLKRTHPRPSLAEQFGIRSAGQVLDDARTVAGRVLGGEGGAGISPSTFGLFRPELSLPAYAGLLPSDGLSPIFNLFDRVGGGVGFRYTVTRDRCRDFRGGRLSYDEHDGTDLVCPPGTPLVAAAPGVVVATRDTFFRGGLTAIVDHGHGVVTQYTHLSRMIAEVGQPVRRGDPVALSGTSGIDMVSGFPWVPPHIHFMVWVCGRPVDPFLAPGEARRAGTWLHGNAPRTAGPLEDDADPPSPADLLVEERVLDGLLDGCMDARVREEIASAPTAAARIALCEDSLHHDRTCWPHSARPDGLRPKGDPLAVRLTLPLPVSEFQGARLADARWTRPTPK